MQKWYGIEKCGIEKCGIEKYGIEKYGIEKSKIEKSSIEKSGIEKNEKVKWIFSAEELRQYIYCARIPFLRHVRKIRANTTASMRRGTKFHQEIVRKRKNLQNWLQIKEKHNPIDYSPKYYFNLYFESATLHLLAYLDLAETNPTTDEIFPVEIKTTSNFPVKRDTVIDHHLIQLTVQSLLIEEYFKTFVSRAKIIYIGKEQNKFQSFWQEISIDMKKVVLKTVSRMHNEFISEDLPKPTRIKERCKVCEYYAFCRKT